MTNPSDEEIDGRAVDHHLEGYVALFEILTLYLAERGTLPITQFVELLKGCKEHLPCDTAALHVRVVLSRAITDLGRALERQQQSQNQPDPGWFQGVIQGGKTDRQG